MCTGIVSPVELQQQIAETMQATQRKTVAEFAKEVFKSSLPEANELYSSFVAECRSCMGKNRDEEDVQGCFNAFFHAVSSHLSLRYVDTHTAGGPQDDNSRQHKIDCSWVFREADVKADAKAEAKADDVDAKASAITRDNKARNAAFLKRLEVERAARPKKKSSNKELVGASEPSSDTSTVDTRKKKKSKSSAGASAAGAGAGVDAGASDAGAGAGAGAGAASSSSAPKRKRTDKDDTAKNMSESTDKNEPKPNSMAKSEEKTQFSMLVTMAEFKHCIIPESARTNVMCQLSDRAAVIMRVQADRQRLITFCAGADGVWFFLVEGKEWVCTTGHLPWTSESVGLLELFACASAEDHGFMLQTAIDLRALVGHLQQSSPWASEIEIDVLRTPPNRSKGAVLRMDTTVVKAHPTASSRDVEETNVKVVVGQGVPTLTAHQLPSRVVVGHREWYVLGVEPVAKWTLVNAPFSEALFRAVGQTCGAVLERAHTRHKVHCDVTPSNILVCESHAVVLNDWGSARAPGSPVSYAHGAAMDFVSPRVKRYINSDGYANYTEEDDLWALLLVLCHFAMTKRKPRPQGVDPEMRIGYLSSRPDEFDASALPLLLSLNAAVQKGRAPTYKCLGQWGVVQM